MTNPASTSAAGTSASGVTAPSAATQMMDPGIIKAPQVGLSDREWNNSRGTISDGHDTNADSGPTRIMSNPTTALVVYFSRSGSTELLAAKVQNLTGADAYEITVKNPYSSDYGATVGRANQERDSDTPPEILTDFPDFSKYLTVYLGYSTWGMTLSEPVKAFLRAAGSQLDGKTIAPFNTNGGYGLGDTVNLIEDTLRKQGATVSLTQPFAIEGNRVNDADTDLPAWIAATQH